MPNALLDKRRTINSHNGQHGAITLVVSLTILMLSTLVTINVTKAILMEQKISNNEARAKQAFEAAEAGMVAALAYLKNDPDVDQDTNIDPVFDTNADGTGDSNTATIGAGSVTVNTGALSDDLTSILIRAQGFSDDGSANHTITQSMATINPLPNAPANPIISKSALTIGGSATVHNNEGHSTIWSGGDIDLGSNNSRAFGNQGSNTTAFDHVTGNNLWEYTLTAGFNVIDNLLIRAEYRMDWGSNIYNTANGNQNGSHSGGPVYYAGAEVVYSF
jgi:hypothetical protein